MKKILLLLCLVLALPCQAQNNLTLEYCLEQADKNYPLLKQYGLIEQTRDVSLSDINRGWLPRVGIYAQATGQNIVPHFPEMLSDMLTQMGQEMRGLGKIQYKVGADITQTIWDGGISKAQREIERASADVSTASVSVGMYAMHQKVIDVFFANLLIDEQIAQTKLTIDLLSANLKRVEAMVNHGTAMQSDADMIEAQLLSVRQALTTAESARTGYRTVLSIYIGEDTTNSLLETPDNATPLEIESNRPELHLYESQKNMNKSRIKATEAAVMPRAGFFAQAYYGYPGINYFESMINRKLSFNIVAGVKLSWNLDALYTKNNSIKKIETDNARIESERETFLFNSNVQTQTQLQKIDGLRDAMKSDSRIVELREKVRKAAESQLVNGVIDTTTLLSKITDENQACLTQSLHKIELIQEIYRLKYILNQ